MISDRAKELFLRKINVDGPLPDQSVLQYLGLGKCHTWTGHQKPNGYGQAHIGKKPEYAHRLSWMIENGEIPQGSFVLHKCDNPLCVNPDHLFLGDAKTNAEDRSQKMRNNSASGTSHRSVTAPEATPKGSAHGRAKLTEESVAEIRSAFQDGVTKKDLATKYGVSWWLIHKIIKGLLWKHVTT